MKTALWLGITLLNLTVGLPHTYADDKADTLSKEVAAAYNAARTLSGKLTKRTEINHKKSVSTKSFELQKPNLARIVVLSEQDNRTGSVKAGDSAGDTIVSDGKYVWSYDKAANTYSKLDVDPNGAIINALDSAAILSSFFTIGDQVQPGSGNRVLQGIAGAFGGKGAATNRYVGRKTFEGKEYDVIEGTIRITIGTTNNAVMEGTTLTYIGQDKFIHRMIVTTKMTSTGKGSLTSKDEEVVTDLKVNKPIPASEFTFLPPPRAALKSSK